MCLRGKAVYIQPYPKPYSTESLVDWVAHFFVLLFYLLLLRELHVFRSCRFRRISIFMTQSHHDVKYFTRKPPPLKTKQDWQERLKNIRLGKKGAEDFEKPGNSTMSFAIFDENLYLVGMRDASGSMVR